MANDKHPPPVIWAERTDKFYITVNVEDCKNVDIKFESTKLIFSGKGGAADKEYEVTMEFFHDIEPEGCHYAVLPRHVPIVVKKKDAGPYWPRLLKERVKSHWLKTDFNKWRDEDDSDVDEGEDMQFENMMKKMGNFNTDSSDGPSLEPEEEAMDSDDEDLPDLE